MIKLDVQEYCHGCTIFKADVQEAEEFYAYCEMVEITDTVVRCKHRRQCERLIEYLRKQVNLDEKSENQ